MVSSTRHIFGLSCAIEAETKREGERAGGRGRPLQKTIFPSSILSFFLCLAGGSTDSSNHHRQRGGAGGGHLGAVERNSGGGGKSRFMNRLKGGSRNVDLGFDDDDEEDDDVREDDEGGFESRRFRG